MNLPSNQYSTKQPPTSIPTARRLLIVALTISLLLSLWIQGPALLDRYRIVVDVQNFYWLARAQDSALFNTDYIYMVGRQLIEVNIFGLRLVLLPVSLGYSLLFYLASYVVDYIWLSKLAVFVLMPLSIFYLFKLGQWKGDARIGLSLSLVFAFFITASAESIALTTGLQRAFTTPLLILFLYYLIKEHYWAAGLMLFVNALFYFPNLPLVTLTYGLAFFKFKHNGSRFRLSLHLGRTKVFGFLLGLTLASLVTALFMGMDAGLIQFSQPTTPLPTFADNMPLTENPRFQSEGYAALFTNFPWLGRTGLFDTGADLINFAVLCLLSLTIGLILGRRAISRVPWPVWGLLLAGLVMYLLSLFFIVVLSSTALYLPSRYTRGTLFMVGVLFVGLNWIDFLQSAPGWLSRHCRAARLTLFFVVTFGLILLLLGALLPGPAIALLALMGLIAAAIVTLLATSQLFKLIAAGQIFSSARRSLTAALLAVLILGLGGLYTHTLSTPPLIPTAQERALYEFVATLPKEVMLAGDPDLLTGIPLFAKRSVLFRGLHPQNDYAILDYFRAKYAAQPAPILAFCRQYDVAYLAFDETTFSPAYLARRNFFYEPYNSYIAEMTRQDSNFALPQMEPIFHSGSIIVIKCDAQTLLEGS